MPNGTSTAMRLEFSRRSFLQRHLAQVVAMAFLPINLQAETSKQLGASVIPCEGTYAGHLQGVCIDRMNNIFWSFTTTLVKTDSRGKMLMKVPVETHHGAPCYADGELYVAVNLGLFNEAKMSADSWIYVYDSNDLSLLRKHRVEEVIYGAGGIAHHKGKFLVVGGLPLGFDENYLYEYDRDLTFKRTIKLKSGYTTKGIQTAAFNDGHWWFGCYGSPERLVKVDEEFTAISAFTFDCALGLIPFGDRFLVARGNASCLQSGGCTGHLVPATMNQEGGLAIAPSF